MSADLPPAGTAVAGFARPALAGYLRIAASLRAEIAAGRLGPGARLPSESQLMIRHRVSRSVARGAFAVLKADGLVEGRQGAGVFVRVTDRLTRHVPIQTGAIADSHDGGAGSPVSTAHRAADTVAAGTSVAARLAIEPGTPVVRTVEVRAAGGVPVQLLTTWRICRSAGIGAAPVAGQVQECLIVRAARPDELLALGMPLRGMVIAIEQTRLAFGRPVEVSDIVLRSDRWEIVYQTHHPAPQMPATLEQQGTETSWDRWPSPSAAAVDESRDDAVSQSRFQVAVRHGAGR
jgi:DNA-binding GntR family transcriptional regulator